jgi:hypothetical protein
VSKQTVYVGKFHINYRYLHLRYHYGREPRMPTSVNPMDALKSFEPALRAGEISVQPGEVDQDVFVHLDHPNGEPRVTYVRFKNSSLTSLAIIIPAEPYKGERCFQIGYAVPQHLRKRGLAKEIARAAIAEFRAGMAHNGIDVFHVEAIVGTKNLASQKVAESIFGKPTKECVDQHSSEPILQYMLKIDGNVPSL